MGGSVLSKAQQKEAGRASALHLDAVATVKRNVSTETPTGQSTALATIYQDIPAHVAPVSDTNPTTRPDEHTTVLDIRAYAWFAPEWPDTRTVVHPSSSPVNVPVVILRGDIIETGGHTWRATTDQDPDQSPDVRKRTRISRPHTGVVA